MEPDKREHRRGGARLQQKPDTARTSRPRKQTKRPRRPCRALSGREKALRVLIGVAIALAAVLIGLVLFWNVFVQKPSIPGEPDLTDLPMESGEQLLTDRPGRTSADRKKDFFTFLVIGRDTGGGGNTDTILLAAYDVPNQKLNVMSIPRDTMVNVSWDIKKINSVYNFNGGGDDGIKALYKEISQLVGFVPDFQVVVEWKAVGELVDALGGVYFDVPRNMNYEDPTQDLSIHVKKGYQKLDGEAAMGVVRYRHDNDMRYGYSDGDLGRIKTQQAFLKAVVKQCLQIQNVSKINELARVFTDNVTTDLTINNLAWFAQEAIFGGLDMENVNFCTMPNEGHMVWSRSYHNYQSYVTPIEDELVDLVNESFNPYKEDLDSSELDIMGVDANGRLTSTTGHVEDSKANSSVGSGSSSSGSGSSSSGRDDSSQSQTSSRPRPSEEPEVSTAPSHSTAPEENGAHGNEEPAASQEPAASTAPEEPVSTPEPTHAPAATQSPAHEEPSSSGGGEEVAMPPEAAA